MATANGSCIFGNCKCYLSTCQIFDKAKEIADSFFEQSTPGTYVQIEMRSIDQLGKRSEVRAQVKLYKINKSTGGNEIFDIMSFRLHNCKDLSIFANYLKITIIQWGVQLSDSEESSD